MSRTPDDHSEIDRVVERLKRLEARQANHERGEAERRVTTAGLTAGVVALVLSLSLPWMRSDEGSHLYHASEGSGVEFGHDSARQEITGWQFLGAGVDLERWTMVLGVLAVLVVALIALPALFRVGKWVLRTAQYSGLALPVILLITWPHSGERDAPVPGGGVWIAVLGALLVGSMCLYAHSQELYRRSPLPAGPR